jgi:ABC-type phosphate transport system substrate-binding protein
MSRTHLLGAASAAALACFTAGANATPAVITGGGSTLAQFDYIAEYSAYNVGTTGATIGSYYEAGSTSGQNAFLFDDLTCDTDKVVPVPTYGKNCYGYLAGTSGSTDANFPYGTTSGAAGNTVVYGASDATLSDGAQPNPGFSNGENQVAFWSTWGFGQALSGNLIQLPSMGVGIAFPVQNANLVNSGDFSLSDNDLCEIFSGGYVNFNQITDSINLSRKKSLPAAGPITVVYRSDGSGTSFILTDHLSKVCTSSNTAAGVTFTATTTFASIFTTVPSNFQPESGSSAVAAEVATLSNAVAYISPDFTDQAPNSAAPVHLKVASGITNKLPYLPNLTNITTGLDKALVGYHLAAPTTAAAGALPSSWVPLIQTVAAGYPVVGYTTYDFAQCYADKTVAAGVVAFLTDHYENSTYTSIQTTNGFVGIANKGSAGFLKNIEKHILTNFTDAAYPAWNVNIGNTAVCQADGAKGTGTYIGRAAAAGDSAQ